ncbi:MAG TPA: MgtC/SapB family protein [Tissierellaceae bacterium]|nr:MgtC/SapB family protein [Tissierellaceae bacterium]
MLEYWIIITRLLLSAILGGLIGLEREASNRPAGFRTHILVTIGSTLIMLVSVDSFHGFADPSRIAAQVVSGIGFLGAGTILRTGNNIEGLTTAASLWVCAGIGLAIGNGYYLAAIATAIIVLFFLKNIGFFERRVLRKTLGHFQFVCQVRAGLIGDIGTILGEHHVIIKDINILGIDLGDKVKEEINLRVKLPSKADLDKLFIELAAVKGMYKILYNGEEIKETGQLVR